MTNQFDKKVKDNSFSSFAVGVSVGVAASFLFGTEEGRRLVKRLVDAIPEKYKHLPDSSPNATYTPVISPQETEHHTTFDYHHKNPSQQISFSQETPPPPPPLVRPSHPEPFRPGQS